MWEMVLKTDDSKAFIESVVSEIREEFKLAHREQFPKLESVDKKLFDRQVEDDVIAFVKQHLLGGKDVPIPNISG